MTLVQAVNELAPVSTAKKKVMDTSAPDAEAIVIGAGPAGLACAAALRKIGKSVVVLEQADKVGSSWRRHYDRLRLHTPKRNSGLPGLRMPGQRGRNGDPAIPVAKITLSAVNEAVSVSTIQRSRRLTPTTRAPKRGAIRRCSAYCSR